MNEQSPQVSVAAPADAVQSRFASRRVPAWHQAEPGRQMPAVPELLGVADGGDHGRGGNRTDTRHLRDLLAQHRLLHERLDRCFDQVDSLLDRLQVLQQFSQQRLAERSQFVGALAVVPGLRA
ncbi:hypothetical protein D3C87_1694020 [compost metagenome]